MTTPNRQFEMPLPANDEAERCVIGGVILDNRLMAQAAESLKPEDFYSSLHRRAFAAMLVLFADEKQIDPITISEELIKDGSLESVGGASAVKDISFGLPFFANIADYIEIVKQKKQVRDLVTACGQISARAMAQQDAPQTVLSYAQTTINAVCTNDEKQGFASLGEISEGIIEKTVALRNREIVPDGLKTDLITLDHITGGFQPSDLIIIGGRPSMGKSALAGQIAMNACRVDPNAVIPIFSLEMSKEQYTQRLICSRAGVDLQRVRTGDVELDELERLGLAAVEFSKLNIDIDDSSSINAVQMRSKLLQLKHRKGRLDGVLIDFLQRMTSSRKFEGRQQEVSGIARDLKSLAKDLNIPVIALSSLSRECEKRQPPRPRIADLRESGDIESEADLVAFLYRPNYYDESANPKLAELLIEKHRNGATGKVDLNFLREYTRFTDY